MLLAIALLTAACGQQQASNVPGDTADESAFSGIAEGAVIDLAGTAPVWSGRIEGGTLSLSGTHGADTQGIDVSRFAGRGGLSYSGQVNGSPVDLAITPGECRNAPGGQEYRFIATLRIGQETREGCARVAGA